MAAHLLDHLLIMVLQQVTEMGSCVRRAQGVQIQTGLVLVPFQNPGGDRTLLRPLPPILGEGTASSLTSHLQETLSTLVLLLGQQAEEAARALQSHIVKVNIGTRREAGVGGLQMHADHAVDGGLHLSEIILRNLGAHRWSVIRN